ncbi:MAG: DUF1887 family CARF protein [Eubacteriales bacterium]|nr:DUF1887 family CARF protein [Eubacteriales bacterium]
MKNAHDSFLAIQYHLYDHPLYTCCFDKDDYLNVLVIGFDETGKRFLDSCLQNGQLRNKWLDVTVAAADRAEVTAYLDARPELPDFFDIDGSLSEDEDAYGSISFKTYAGDGNGNASNNLNEWLQRFFERKRNIHYIFVSLGKDHINKSVANTLKAAAEIIKMNCVISFAMEDDTAAEENDPLFCPLFINGDVKKRESYADIERMAFNTHLVWEKSLNVNHASVRKDFRREYNRSSCISNVLSIKYKLHSIDIDFEALDNFEAAKLFEDKLSGNDDGMLRNELIWIEHRRWVTEKLCLGWRSFTNLEDCLTGVTKDERNKRHVCIKKSRPDQILAEEYCVNGNYDKWDRASDVELDELDDLDRMSVELHRIYRKRAALVIKENLLSGSSIAAIKTLISGNNNALVAFHEWFTCLKDIQNGDVKKVRRYKTLKQAFLDAAEILPFDRKKAVQEHVSAFDTLFFPVRASMEHRDWKQDDAALIDNIPFILTYTENTYLVVPFAEGDKTSVFSNAAAATMVNPERLLYLYSVERKQDLDELLCSIPLIIEYMRKKNFRSAVEFILFCTGEGAAYVNKEIGAAIIGLGGKRIRQVKRIEAAQVEDMNEVLTPYLQSRCIGKEFFAIERNYSRTASILKGAGVYRSFPHYSFDLDSMKFSDISGCEMLSHIKKTPILYVTDMTAFNLSSSTSSNHPEFYSDYGALWRTYQEKSASWKNLCEAINKHIEKNDTIASFKRKSPSEKAQTKEKYTYILPSGCGKNAEFVLRLLKDYEILERESRIGSTSTDSCVVTIYDRCDYKGEYDKLFSNIKALMLPGYIRHRINVQARTVHIVVNDLNVVDVSLPAKRGDEINALMNFFSSKGYVINYQLVDNKMSFTFSTWRFKDLLTTAGRMLEIYTYHKVKELGAFDDVVSSFEIDWEGTNVKSEFDCILTKGFRMLFIECKARTEIEQDPYFKLSELKEKFGINATAVLIADTQEKPHWIQASTNEMQRTRGKMLNVVTVWKSNEIDDIGNTLLDIINGSYSG